MARTRTQLSRIFWGNHEHTLYHRRRGDDDPGIAHGSRVALCVVLCRRNLATHERGRAQGRTGLLCASTAVATRDADWASLLDLLSALGDRTRDHRLPTAQGGAPWVALKPWLRRIAAHCP